MLIHKTRRMAVLVCLAMTVMAAGSPTLYACPFCQPTKTLGQELSDQAAVAVAVLAGGEPATEDEPGTSVYVVKSVLKSHENQPRVDSEITLEGSSSQPKGSLFLMFGARVGTKNPKVVWSTKLEVSGERLSYITKLPSSEQPTRKRLLHFRDFLEHADITIANDAYAEFANARFEDIIEIADELPRDKIRLWLFDPKTPAIRLGLYGLLLGIVGTADDAKTMESHITKPTSEMRLGIDGMMAGYLWLNRTEALKQISGSHLDSEKPEHPETYAALQAIRFMWQYGEGKIPPNELQAAVRRLLDREQYAELAIVDLARWKDWSLLDRMCDLAGDSKAELRVREVAIRFVIACSRDIPKNANPDAPLPPHVLKSQAALKGLKISEPKLAQILEQAKG